MKQAACEFDLQLFLTTYFPRVFLLEWTDDQKKLVAALGKSILEGGCFALPMPRGSGKTSILARAAIWAFVYRHRRFVRLISAGDLEATSVAYAIQVELTCNEALMSDFGEVCRSSDRILAGPMEQCWETSLSDGLKLNPDLVLTDGVHVYESTMNAAVTCMAGAGIASDVKTKTLHGVTCERVEPIAPEVYICSWPDRHKFVLGLLSEGKGTRVSRREAIEGAPGIAGQPFAVVEVESYAPSR